MTRARLERRLAALRGRLADSGIDAWVTRYGPNVRYLTGFSGSNGLLWVDSSRARVFTDGRYATEIADEVPAGLVETAVARDGLWQACREWAESRAGARAVAFESDRLTHWEASRLGEWTGIEWRPERGWIEALREVKDADEVEAIRAAARVALDALEETQPLIRPGVREMEIAAELDYRLRRAAPEGPAFETIVLTGERTALPHGRAGARELRLGDLVLIDFGATRDGYRCDVTRTWVVGRASPRQREVHSAVCEAFDAAVDRLRADVEGRRVDEAAREALSRLGFAEAVQHGTGHGLGLEVHEAPRLHRDEGRPLRPGMVVTVEPGLYFPGWGGIRVEDDYRVAEGGAECLTLYPRDLQEL